MGLARIGELRLCYLALSRGASMRNLFVDGIQLVLCSYLQNCRVLRFESLWLDVATVNNVDSPFGRR